MLHMAVAHFFFGGDAIGLCYIGRLPSCFSILAWNVQSEKSIYSKWLDVSSTDLVWHCCGTYSNSLTRGSTGPESHTFRWFVLFTVSDRSIVQEAQLSPRDRAMRRVSWNLASCHAQCNKKVLNQVSAVANWPVRQNRAVDSAWRSVR